MGFVSNMPYDDYRLNTMGMDDPATQIRPDGAFSGLTTALGHSIVGGLAAVTRTWDAIASSNNGTALYGGDWVNPPTEMPTAPGEHPTALTEPIKALQEWAKVDPRTTGPAAQVAGATARGLTIMGAGSLLGGPVAGAGLLGGTEGYNDFADSRAAGVEQTTALEKAGLTGGAAFAGAFLPMAVSGKVALNLAGLGMQAEVAGNSALANVLFGAGRAAAVMSANVAARLGTAAAVNTGFGMANRYLTSNLLESAGYHDMAAQYKTLDGQAIASDAVLGLAFGGFGLAEEVIGRRLGALERPDQATIQAAFDVRRQEMLARGTGGLPTDPHTANLDLELQDRALADTLRGRDVQVDPAEARRIVEGSLLDPERVQAHEDWIAANQKLLGDLAETAYPVRMDLPVQPFAVPEEGLARPAVPPTAEGAAKLDPMVQEQARQLAARAPDLDVQLPDGTTVKAADMQQAMAEQMAKASKDSSLIDVATACFLRTLL
jgi:hypothetical protein